MVVEPVSSGRAKPRTIALERRVRNRTMAVWAFAVLLGTVAIPILSHRLGEEALRARAGSLAASVAVALGGGDPGPTSRAPLRSALADPDVLLVEVLDGQGRRLAAESPRSAPGNGTPQAPAGDAVVVEEPVRSGGDAASVRMYVSTENLAAETRRRWYASVGGAVVLLPLGFLLAGLVTAGAFAPMARTDAADDVVLDGRVGEVLDRLRDRSREADQRVRWLEKILDRVLDHPPLAMAIFDDERRCLKSGASPLPWLGRASVLPGTRLADAWRASGVEDVGWAEEAFRRCLRQGRAVEHEESIPVTEGSERRIWTLWLPVSEEGRQAVVLMARDETEAVRDRATRTELEHRLSRAERLETVGRLAGSVAHDFNNILTVIRGFCDLLQMELPEDAPEIGDLGEIRVASERGRALTGRLLGFARSEPAENPEGLDMVRAVERARGMIARILGESVTLEVDAEAGLGLVPIDPVRLEQILLNLASNAGDAMPDGGSFTIRLRTAEGGTAPPSGPPRLLERAVVLSVADTGEGMDQKTASQIFEAFFTTKTEGRGTGLGLATVQEIISEVGGFVEVDSAPGVGTTFHMHLPTVESAPSSSKEAVARGLPGAPTGHGEPVLVVDDDPQLLRLMARVLKERGYEVEARSAPEPALEAARNSEVRLLVTDVAMPKLSGPELAAEVRALHPDVRVLFVSGHGDKGVQERGLDRAVDAFLPKPFSPEALAWQVRKLLDEADALD